LLRQAIALKRFAEAITAARVWGIEGVDPAVLNSLAWSGSTGLRPNNPHRDLNLLLACANRAVSDTRRTNPAFMDTLARVRWERGERDAAIATQREAIAVLDAQPAPSDATRAAQREKLRADMAAALNTYLDAPVERHP
jgi:hypothetical protein